MTQNKKEGICPVCSRLQDLTFHHLIPRTFHSNKWYKKNFTRDQMETGVMVCRLCHENLHRLISEKEMGREYNTLEKLLGHEKVIAYVPWAKKQK